MKWTEHCESGRRKINYFKKFQYFFLLHIINSDGENRQYTDCYALVELRFTRAFLPVSNMIPSTFIVKGGRSSIRKALLSSYGNILTPIEVAKAPGSEFSIVFRKAEAIPQIPGERVMPLQRASFMSQNPLTRL